MVVPKHGQNEVKENYSSQLSPALFCVHPMHFPLSESQVVALPLHWHSSQRGNPNLPARHWSQFLPEKPG